MTKQVINIGTVANDDNGDSLRTAGTKINDNFTEVYDANAANELTAATAQSAADAAQASANYSITQISAAVPVGLDATGATSASTVMQTALDNANSAGGGILFVPPGLYKLGTPLIPRSGVKLRGVPPILGLTSPVADSGFPIIGGTRFIGATLLSGVTAGMIAFQGNHTGNPGTDSVISNFWLEDIGFKNFQQVMQVGSQNWYSFMGGGLRNVYVDGTKGTAFEIANMMHWDIDGLYTFRAQQVLDASSYHSAVSCGNSIWKSIYGFMPGATTTYEGYAMTKPAFGIRMRARTSGGVVSHFNAVRIISPQINCFGPSPIAGSAHIQLFSDVGASPVSRVINCAIHDADLEGSMNYAVFLDGAQGNFIHFGATSATAECTAWYKAQNSSNSNHVHSNSATVNWDVDSTSDPWTATGRFVGPIAIGAMRPRGIIYRQDTNSLVLNAFGHGDYDMPFISTGSAYTISGLRPIEPVASVGGATFNVFPNTGGMGRTLRFSLNGAQTATLPAASTLPGYTFRFAFVSAASTGTKTITDGTFSDTIEGGTHKMIKVFSDGNRWMTELKV